MALNFTSISRSAAFAPNAPFPLDARSIFDDYSVALASAKTAVNIGTVGAKSAFYFGQTVTVLNPTTNAVRVFSIVKGEDGVGGLQEVGAATLGDDKTIILENGTLSLKDFGKQYYKYVPKSTVIEGTWTYPGTMPGTGKIGDYAQAGDVWYIMNENGWEVAAEEPNLLAEKYVLTQGWKSNLTPKSAQIEGVDCIAWYEPSTVTVEDVSALVSGMETRVTNLEGSVTTLNGDASTEGSVKHTVANIIATYFEGADSEKIDNFKELVEWANAHQTDVVGMNTAIETNSINIQQLTEFVGTLPEGSVATTIVGYIQEVAATAAAAVKSVTAHATKNGYIVVDDIEVKVYELPTASIDTLGGVKVDSTTIVIAGDGTISVGTIPVSKLNQEELSALLEETKSAAVTAAAEAAALVHVLKTEVATEVDPDRASETFVISEKALLDSMNWKTVME